MKKILLITALSLSGSFCLATEKNENEDKTFYEMVRWWANKMDNEAEQEEKGLYEKAGKHIISCLRKHWRMYGIKKASCSRGGMEYDGGVMCRLSTKIAGFYSGCLIERIRIEDLDFETSSEKIYHLEESQS